MVDATAADTAGDWAAVLLDGARAVLDDASLARLNDSLGPAAAAIRYRRLCRELGRLRTTGSDGDRVAEFVCGDAVVLARMAAAVEVLRCAGLDPDPAVDAPAHLNRAVRWKSYAAAPAPALHRSCAADVARGSLRLWSLAGGVPAGLTRSPDRAPTRAQLGLRARRVCRELHAGLAAEAAALSPAGIGGYERRVRREVLRVAAEFAPGLPVEGCFSPRRRSRLEHRLAALLGTGFGFSVSLTAGRIVADLDPEWAGAGAAVCAVLGMALTCWVVRARRLLTDRAASERWMAEVVANLRAAMEERVIAADRPARTPAVRAADPVPDRRPRAMGHNPRLTADLEPALTFNQEHGSLRD